MALAVIGGAGSGSQFSHALMETLLSQGFHVAVITRNPGCKARFEKAFAQKSRISFYQDDLNDAGFVKAWLQEMEDADLAIDVYIHQAAKLVLKPFLETDIRDFEQSWQASVRSAAVVAQVLIPHMLKHTGGTLIFTGATASMRGGAGAAAFAVAKFGLRALAQSLAREFGPQGIHVAHVVVDGVIVGDRAQNKFGMAEGKCIQADALANVYLNLIQQDRSCWTQEIDVRPAEENF